MQQNRQQIKEKRQKWMNEYHEEKKLNTLSHRSDIHNVSMIENEHSSVNYLIENELNFNCSICLEMMISPLKEPLLLIPCSHTFCKECIFRQKISKMIHHQNLNLFRNRLKKCPLCRESIQSFIGNIQLRQLIDKMLNLKDKESQNVQKHINTQQILTFRKTVLIQELKSTKKERKKLDHMMNSYQLIIDHLRDEEIETKKRYNSVKRELELIEKQLDIKSDEMIQLKLQRTKASTKYQLLQDSVSKLQSDLDKFTILS